MLFFLYLISRNKRAGGEYYYDYGDYGAGVAVLPDAERVMGSQVCQPCAAKRPAGSKPTRPDSKLFRDDPCCFYQQYSSPDLATGIRFQPSDQLFS